MGSDENQIDEVALNTLLAEGFDPATAYVASHRRPAPASPAMSLAVSIVAFLCFVAAALLWFL